MADFSFAIPGILFLPLAGLKVSSYSLPIESGRLYIPHHTNLCNHCSFVAVGEKKHFVFQRPSLQLARAKYQFL